jgi:hypothetical protein
MTSSDTFFRRVADVYATLGSATRAARATQAGRSPAAVDLERLGIDPRAFLTMGHG